MSFPRDKRVPSKKPTGSSVSTPHAKPEAPPPPVVPPKEHTKKTVKFDDTKKVVEVTVKEIADADDEDKAEFVATEAVNKLSLSEISSPPTTQASAQTVVTIQPRSKSTHQRCGCTTCPAETRIEKLTILLHGYETILDEIENSARWRNFIMLRVQDPLEYWNNDACRHLESRLLVARVGLQFPAKDENPIYATLK